MIFWNCNMGLIKVDSNINFDETRVGDYLVVDSAWTEGVTKGNRYKLTICGYETNKFTNDYCYFVYYTDDKGVNVKVTLTNSSPFGHCVREIYVEDCVDNNDFIEL